MRELLLPANWSEPPGVRLCGVVLLIPKCAEVEGAARACCGRKARWRGQRPGGGFGSGSGRSGCPAASYFGSAWRWEWSPPCRLRRLPPCCLWCHENSTCVDYPVSQLIPPSSVCALSESYWAVCWVNFEAIIITIGVVGGSLLLVILCCCCYCCCRCCSRRCCSRRGFCNLGWCFLILRRVAEEEESFIRDREEKRLQQLQRKLERKMKHDEIRKKYGLLQDSDHPYSRYENE
uniref:Pituitary tumor-transforming gene 1 protein-interacting protein n=1 Tax=Varanus komodoensis TaxID=61221 RepID=A0A8D2KSJ7_VARKO